MSLLCCWTKEGAGNSAGTLDEQERHPSLSFFIMRQKKERLADDVGGTGGGI